MGRRDRRWVKATFEVAPAVERWMDLLDAAARGAAPESLPFAWPDTLFRKDVQRLQRRLDGILRYSITCLMPPPVSRAPVS